MIVTRSNTIEQYAIEHALGSVQFRYTFIIFT